MIEVHEELGSTSDELARQIASGQPVVSGMWIVANRQTSGRGRQGRVWFDGRGNFMGSTFVAQQAGDPPLSTLSLATGLAVAAAVRPYLAPVHDVRLKWPNDLLVDGAKVSGILLEGAKGGVIVGIGVNLSVAPEVPDRPTTSIANLGGAVSRDTFAECLAKAFAEELIRWRSEGLAAVIQRWQQAAHPIGTPLRVGDGDGERLEGTFAGLAADGALQLRLADGTMRVIHAGEVNLAEGN